MWDYGCDDCGGDGVKYCYKRLPRPCYHPGILKKHKKVPSRFCVNHQKRSAALRSENGRLLTCLVLSCLYNSPQAGPRRSVSLKVKIHLRRRRTTAARTEVDMAAAARWAKLATLRGEALCGRGLLGDPAEAAEAAAVAATQPGGKGRREGGREGGVLLLTSSATQAAREHARRAGGGGGGRERIGPALLTARPRPLYTSLAARCLSLPWLTGTSEKK